MLYDISAIKKHLAEQLSDKRYQHTERVVEWAIKLAQRYGVDQMTVEVAAYLHDIAKQMTFDDMITLIECDKDEKVDPLFYDMPQIVHATAGACLAKSKFGITDQTILNAIKYHTTGRAGMSDVESIIYIADATENGRDYPKLKEHRAVAKKSLRAALKIISADTICYLITMQKPIHPNTVALYNQMHSSEGAKD